MRANLEILIESKSKEFSMKRWYLMSLSLCAVGCGVTMAQPPMGPEGGPPPHNPIMEALDPDHDHVISSEEIQAAVAALLKLDTNQDGQLTEDEFRQQHPGGHEGPQGGPPPDGRPPRDDRRGPPPPRDGFGPPQGFGPPGRQGGPERGTGEGPRGPRPEQRDPEQRGPEQRGPEQRGSEQRGMGPGREQGPGPGGPHDPERFVEHAMEFDADKDGLLSKEELLTFAREGMRRGGPGGPGDGRGPEGRGPEGRGPGGRGPGDQPRPQRPQRPE